MAGLEVVRQVLGEGALYNQYWIFELKSSLQMQQVQTLVEEARPRDRNGVEDTHPPIRVNTSIVTHPYW